MAQYFTLIDSLIRGLKWAHTLKPPHCSQEHAPSPADSSYQCLLKLTCWPSCNWPCTKSNSKVLRCATAHAGQGKTMENQQPLPPFPCTMPPRWRRNSERRTTAPRTSSWSVRGQLRTCGCRLRRGVAGRGTSSRPVNASHLFPLPVWGNPGLNKWHGAPAAMSRLAGLIVHRQGLHGLFFHVAPSIQLSQNGWCNVWMISWVVPSNCFGPASS